MSEPVPAQPSTAGETPPPSTTPTAGETAPPSTMPASTMPASTMPASPTPAEDASLLERTLFEVKRVIVGQDRMIERMLAAVLARGHCLLEGVPGGAKPPAGDALAT